MAEWKKVIVSGSDAELRTLTASFAISASNINVGVPTSNQWQVGLNGSYFNNFTTQTDTSEILRFIAGLLSASAPDASPNTKTYSAINAVASANNTGIISGFYPTGHTSVTNDTLKYLENKGFVSTGGTVFSGIPSVFNNGGYSYAYTSLAGGSTTVSSSVDGALFGLGTLTSGGPTTFRVSGSINWRFDDNSSNTQTAASSSENILTTSTFGTTAGLTLAKINTANTAVIPPAYQDGKFVSIFSSGLWNNGVSFTSVSSSGYYHISASIRIASGSSLYSSAATSFNRIFYAPTTNIATAIGNNTLSVNSTNVVSSGSYTSGSMSGAPFLTSARYTLSVTASGVFNPLYAAASNVSSVAIIPLTATGTVNLGLTTGVSALSTVGGIINTPGVVFTSAGSPKNIGTPAYDDQIRYENTYTISGPGRTFADTGATDSDFAITVSALDRSSNSSTLSTNTVPIHTAGTFGQPEASGSLLYFGGGTPNTALIEYFTSESFRRTIGTSTALTGTWNRDTALTLGDGGPLQVKPGFLVNPESTKGYWYPTSGYNPNHYKWYLREFDTGATANISRLTITLSPASSVDLVDFSNIANDKIAIGVIFERQLPANSGDPRTRIFDTVKGNSSYGGSLNNQATGLYNPFSNNVDIVGDFSSPVTNNNGVLTLTLNNTIFQTINGTYKKIWLLIRYKGTPANSLQQIAISTSA